MKGAFDQLAFVAILGSVATLTALLCSTSYIIWSAGKRQEAFTQEAMQIQVWIFRLNLMSWKSRSS